MMSGVKDTKPKRVTRTEKRALATRKRLLAAALEKFCEKGVDATTIADITEGADLGKGTFYRHFSSKEEIMIALIEDAVDRLIACLSQVKGKARDLREVLERMLEAHLDFFTANRDEFVLLFQGRLLLKLERDETGELEQPFTSYLEEIERQIAPFVDGPIEPVKARRLASAVAGFVSGFLSFAMIGMSQKEAERSTEPLRRAFVSGSMAFLAEKPQNAARQEPAPA